MPRLIPPLLFLFLLVCLGALSFFHDETLMMRKDKPMPWDMILPMGMAILIWARYHFITRKAEIHTFKNPTELVTDGPFRFSRNPMYLGFTILLLAAAFYVNTWCALLAPLVFWAAASLWYIPHEERTLREAFGANYDDYAWQTRRWI